MTRTLLCLLVLAAPCARAATPEALRAGAALEGSAVRAPTADLNIPPVGRGRPVDADAGRERGPGAAEPAPLPHEFDLPLAEYDAKTKSYPRVRSADLRGKVVLLDFWATWCDPCVRKLPTVEAWSKTYGPRGLAVYAVATWTSWDDLTAFRKGRPIALPVLFDGEDGKVRARFGGGGVPHLVLLGPDGSILKEGGVRAEDIERALEKLRD